MIPPNDKTRIQTARQLFQRAQEIEPDFAGGYAGESFSHSITVLFLNTDKPEEDLARALPLAEKSIAVDPNFGMGYTAGRYADALQTLDYNLQRRGPRGPHMDLFKAAVDAQLGQQVQAREIVRSLDNKAPGFPAEKWLGMWLSNNNKLEQTLQLLRYEES